MYRLLHLSLLLGAYSYAIAQPLQVTSFSPAAFTLGNADVVDISVQFNQDIDIASISSANFRVFGDITGFHSGVYNYEANTRVATFSASLKYAAGERVHVILTGGITSGGTGLSNAYQWSFFIQTQRAGVDFTLDNTYALNGSSAPHFIAVGDVDEDGEADVVIVNNKAESAEVWANNGGSFSNLSTLLTGSSPRAMNMADYDSDGDLDVAIPSELDSTLLVYQNNGDGTYVLSDTKTTGASPVWAEHADIDGDGALDLVVANLSGNSFSVFFNNGNAVFQNRLDYPVSGIAPESILLADFDNDGDVDIALVTSGSNQIITFDNDGLGAFINQKTFSVGQTPRVITGHDLNGDNFIDLAVCNRVDNSASVLLNSGGNFQPAVDYPTDVDAFSIVAGDLDGDRDADLVVTSHGANSFNVLLNDAAGNIAINSTYATQQQPRAVNIADFNGDGRLDIAVANRGSDTFQIYTNSSPPPNNLPAAPALISPLQNTHFNPQQQPIALSWLIPTDQEGDNLHFLVEFASDQNFSSIVLSVDSRSNISGFTPAPPVAQGNGVISYAVATQLGDEEYFWRISAHDGVAFGATSEVRRLVVDTLAPTITVLTFVNPSPEFAPNWYNQKNTASFDAQTQYSEINAANSVFDFGSLGSRLINPLSSGLNQTVTATLNIQSAVDGTYPVALTVSDSAGNLTGFAGQSLRLDSTSPVGAIANSPAVSDQPTFIVTWDGASDGTGSGLSERYDIQVRINNSQWTAWLTGFSGKSAIFTGQHGLTYAFEAAAYDNLGNRETFVNIAETATQIDTSIDRDAPPKPVNLLANGASPSPWQNTDQFNVTWQNPVDKSGIAAAFFKLGSPPLSNFDIIGSVNNQTSLNLKIAQENGQMLYVWLQDSSSNINFNNADSVWLRYDKTLPIGATARSQNTSSSLLIQVSWDNTASDGVGSGISGAYNVRVQENNGPWTAWLTNFQGVSSIFPGRHNSVYGFEAAAIDNAGNVELFTGAAETITIIDTTGDDIAAPGSPLNLMADGANPSPWKKSPDFAITWSQPYDQSGIARTFMKLGGQPVADFDTSRTLLSGADLRVIVGAENGQNLYVWLQDSLGNVDYRTAGRIVLRYDATAPTGAIARSPEITSLRSILVQWDGLADDGAGSGLSGLYNLRIQTNGGDWDNSFQNIQGNSFEYIGAHGTTYGFEALAIDSVGNVEAILNIAESITRVDTNYSDPTLPTILHTPMPNVELGQPLIVSAQINDDIQVLSANLFFRAGGASVFLSRQMINSGGDSYVATLSANEIDETGIHYYVEVSDGASIVRQPSYNWQAMPYNVSARITGNGGVGLVRSAVQPGGSSAQNYRMLSIPVLLDNPSPQAVLEDDLGKYDAGNWRLFQYVSSSGKYREYPDIDNFSLSRVFWLISKKTINNLDSGIGASAPSNRPFEITLTRGWNDVGSPFTFPISVDQIQIIDGDSSDLSGPFTYDGAWVLPDQVLTIEPWKGYSFYCDADQMKLALKPWSKNAAQSKSTNADIAWRIGIHAESATASDHNAGIGVSAKAVEGWDRFDFPEPHKVSDFVSVRFPRSDWGKFNNMFKTDFRPAFVDGQSWQFEVESNSPDEAIELRFEGLSTLPGRMRAKLFDYELLRSVTLSPESSYLIQGGRESREFELIVGTDAFISAHNSVDGRVPKAFSLSPNFPNPFNAGTSFIYKLPITSHVKIAVVNILGKTVRKLENSEQKAGVYRINWDGRNQAGIEIATGVYFIQIQASDFVRTRKILLLR